MVTLTINVDDELAGKITQFYCKKFNFTPTEEMPAMEFIKNKVLEEIAQKMQQEVIAEAIKQQQMIISQLRQQPMFDAENIQIEVQQ